MAARNELLARIQPRSMREFAGLVAGGELRFSHTVVAFLVEKRAA